MNKSAKLSTLFMIIILMLPFGCSKDEEANSMCMVGDVCDDNNPLTENDKYNSDCECGGLPIASTFTDSRDGQSYNIVIIGSQAWFAENLNYDSDNSWCYDDNSNNCSTYGRLYDWQTALNACPGGWHLPSDAEWTVLSDYLGGQDLAGGKMKETGTSNWTSPNTDATNESGFTGRPGGYYNWNDNFDMIGNSGWWWSSTEISSANAWYKYLGYNSGGVDRGSNDKRVGFGCRCLKD